MTGLEKIKFCGTGSLLVTSRNGLLETVGVHRTKEVGHVTMAAGNRRKKCR
jgi:hypothetical protein